MPPRRSHKKSRAGCRRCKVRKIKCDEVHPRCGNCVKHGVSCDFEKPSVTGDLRVEARSPSASNHQPTSPVLFGTPLSSGSSSSRSSVPERSPRPRLPLLQPLCRPPPTVLPSGIAANNPQTNSNRMLELRLMHHYTSCTAKTLALSSAFTRDVWMVDVPKLAFGGATYLSDAMLAVSALHLRWQNPDDKTLVQASHAYMASSLAAYCDALRNRIDETNSEALFLTASLIAFQSTATRVLARDEPSPSARAVSGSTDLSATSTSEYSLPLPTFHAFQGVKAVVVSSWQWIRNSSSVLRVIDAQPALELDLDHITQPSFFGGLLDGLDEDIAAEDEDMAAATADAYRHAVSFLNWSHKSPHAVACLAFPAVVSRRFVELLEMQQPRAMVILANFFALVRRVDHAWWLDGISRREVTGIRSLFEPDSPWLRHLDWPTKIALYEGSIPPELWGSHWEDLGEEQRGISRQTFVQHIELVSRMMANGQTGLPAITPFLSGVVFPEAIFSETGN